MLSQNAIIASIIGKSNNIYTPGSSLVDCETANLSLSFEQLYRQLDSFRTIKLGKWKPWSSSSYNYFFLLPSNLRGRQVSFIKYVSFFIVNCVTFDLFII